MNKLFTANGWSDYTYWKKEDKQTLNRINDLILPVIDVEKKERLLNTLYSTIEKVFVLGYYRIKSSLIN